MKAILLIRLRSRPFSDMMFIGLFMDNRANSFLCNIKDPIAQKIYLRNTRIVTEHAELFLEANQIVESAFFG